MRSIAPSVNAARRQSLRDLRATTGIQACREFRFASFLADQCAGVPSMFMRFAFARKGSERAYDATHFAPEIAQPSMPLCNAAAVRQLLDKLVESSARRPSIASLI